MWCSSGGREAAVRGDGMPRGLTDYHIAHNLTPHHLPCQWLQHHTPTRGTSYHWPATLTNVTLDGYALKKVTGTKLKRKICQKNRLNLLPWELKWRDNLKRLLSCFVFGSVKAVVVVVLPVRLKMAVCFPVKNPPFLNVLSAATGAA